MWKGMVTGMEEDELVEEQGGGGGAAESGVGHLGEILAPWSAGWLNIYPANHSQASVICHNPQRTVPSKACHLGNREVCSPSLDSAQSR